MGCEGVFLRSRSKYSFENTIEDSHKNDGTLTREVLVCPYCQELLGFVLPFRISMNVVYNSV